MSFDYQPVLKGKLVELRPLRQDDFEKLYEVASDPLIWKQHPVPTRYERGVFVAFFQESLQCEGALVALDPKTGRVIGSSRFHGYCESDDEVEIGWTFLARSCWGGRYNREIKSLMLEHAFRFVRRVIFLVGPDNFRSQRALEKIGAVRVGSRADGSGLESYLYEFTASMHANRRSSTAGSSR